MYRAPSTQRPRERFVVRHRWIAALIAGTVLTPIAIVLGMLAPARTGTPLVWPMVVLMGWAGPGPNIGTPERPVYEGTPVHLAAAVVGLLLSWTFYVLIARIVLWRIAENREERGLTR